MARLKIKTVSALKTTMIAVAVFALTAGFTPHFSSAQSVGDIQRQIDELNQEIDQSQSRVEELRQRGNTLQNRLNLLNAEANQLQAEIDLTEREINRTRAEIRELEASLRRTRELIQENVRVLYKYGSPSTLEILFSSNNFTDFVNRQEYLDRVKSSLNEAARESVLLKQDLEAKEADLNVKSSQLEAQQRQLAIKQEEQRRLVAETRGEESRYKDYVARLKKERAEADQLLLQMLSSIGGGSGGANMLVKQGDQVSAGQPIGFVGNTGDSSGPHLHFSVAPIGSYNYVSPNTPEGSRNPNLRFGFTWPVPGYNCINDPFLAGSHNGIDIIQSNGAYGCPDLGQPNVNGAQVVAAGAGTVSFSGSHAAGDDIDWRFGNLIIIDHSNGYRTFYAHLQ